MTSTGQSPRYKRVLLKLSGEALMGDGNFGISPGVITRVANDVGELVGAGVEVAIVIGGGNIFRGAGLADAGMNRVAGDHMGMLATVMNSLAMQDALEKTGLSARVMSALSMPRVCEEFVQRNALEHLDNGRVIILAAGTGNPYFTTDSAASLRAIEIRADLMIKATKVDGVYSADPVLDKSAVKYNNLTYDEVLARKLNVMDATSVVLCRDNGMPLCVLDMNKPGSMMRAVMGEEEGTVVGP